MFLVFRSHVLKSISFNKMNSKDIQKLVISKYKNGNSARQRFDYLKDALGRITVFEWCRMIRNFGCIQLSTPMGCPCLVRAK
jgi:hypothetical protein